MSLIQLIINLFGEYTPLTDNNGNVITGISGINFAWLSGVLIFCILIVCIFKLFGGWLKNDRY